MARANPTQHPKPSSLMRACVTVERWDGSDAQQMRIQWPGLVWMEAREQSIHWSGNGMTLEGRNKENSLLGQPQGGWEKTAKDELGSFGENAVLE